MDAGEPRTWKWLLPAFGVPGSLAMGMLINWLADQYQMPWLLFCNVVIVFAGIFMAIQAAAMFKAYYRKLEVDDFVAKQKAQATTELVLLSENMKALHPSAVNVLAMFGRSTWHVIPGSLPEDDPVYVLYPTQVTYEFIAEFLSESSDTLCPAEWKLTNDGAKHYAPEGLKEGWCTDREQYQQLITYLQRRLMVTMPYGNQPAAYLGAWNPRTVAKVLNIALDESDEKVESN